MNQDTLPCQPLECRCYPFDSDLYREAVNLRNAVLRKPLGLQWTERDFLDEDKSLHLGAFRGDRLVAVLILTPREAGTIQMRQVAVAPEERLRGVGSALVRYAEQVAVEHGYRIMMAHARESVIDFYYKLDYQVIGDRFIEIGIPHLHIAKEL